METRMRRVEALLGILTEDSSPLVTDRRPSSPMLADTGPLGSPQGVAFGSSRYRLRVDPQGNVGDDTPGDRAIPDESRSSIMA
jgi:hypothetical protein